MISPSKGEDRILAFDPGHTTGISLLINNEHVLGIVATQQMILQESVHTSLLKLFQPTVVLIERPPQSARFNTESVQEIYQYILRFYTHVGLPVHLVLPGQWKGLVERSPNLGKHIQDATDLARWYYRTKGAR